MQRKALKLDQVKKVVLDESDEMLKMGFTESINTILLEVPESHSTLLFSATMPPGVAAITKNYMTNPLEITIGNKNAGAENIKHLCYTVHAKDKYLALKRIADYNPNIYGIIFCRTRRETQEVADKLIQDGYNADSLHGDLSQAQRDYVMQKFRIKNISLLVATDVAARGLDVDNLTHVINYNLPDDIEAYTHRSGRTGRAGKSGVSIAIINMREKHLVRQIEKLIKKTFINTPVPGGREICEKQLFSMVDKMEKVELDHTEIDTYLPVIYRKLEWLDKEELIKRFVSLEFNRFIEYYKNAQDININEDSKERGNPRERNSEPRRSGPENGYTRLFINIGKLDDLWPKNLIEIINQNTKGAQSPVGKIDILQKFSFFEVESKYTNDIIRALKGVPYGNITISVEIAQGKEEGGRSERGGGGGYSGGNRRDGFKRRSDSNDGGGYKKPSGDRSGDRGGRDGGFKRRSDSNDGGGFKRRSDSNDGGGCKKASGGENWGTKRSSDAGANERPKRKKY